MALQESPNAFESGMSGMSLSRFRIERGAAVIGTDDQIGTVEQIVVDRDSGELRSMIVRSPDGVVEFELDARHIERSTGEHVYVNVGRADIATHPELVRPYDPAQYIPVNQGEATSAEDASRTALATEHPIVTDVEANAAELVAPETHAAPTPAAAVTPTPVQEPAPPPAEAATDSAATGEAAGTTIRPGPPVAMDAPEAGAFVPPAVHATEPIDEAASPAAGSGAEAQGTRDEEQEQNAEEPQEQEQEQEPRVPLTSRETRDPERPLPHQEPSATPSTTGPMVNDRPSTGGMGDASSVPSSPVPPQDTINPAPAPPTPAQDARGAMLTEPETTAEAASPLRTGVPTVPLADTGIDRDEVAASPAIAAPAPTIQGISSAPATARREGPSAVWVLTHLPPRVYVVAGGLFGGIVLGMALRRRRKE